MKKNGFTLSEILITLVIIGVISGLLLTTLKDLGPNSNKVLFKKAYSIVERTVVDMINNEDWYPESISKPFFSNTTTENLDNIAPEEKFCSLFSRDLNRTDMDLYCNNTSFVENESVDPQKNRNKVSFVTSDNMQWIIPPTEFTEEDEKRAQIFVDVNGEKQPNCTYHKTNCKQPDRFTIYVNYDGKVKLNPDTNGEGIETHYLYNDNITKKDTYEN